MNCAIFQEPVSVLRRNGRSCSPLQRRYNLFRGDDLLALLPPKASSGETVFHFARDAKDLFQKSFKTYIDAIKAANAEKKPGEEPLPVPSLSLGISICYSKFPLYEALDDSADLLFRLRKEQMRQNCVAVRLQKHSGRAECLVLKGIDGLTAFTNFLDDMPKKLLTKACCIR